MKKLIVLVMIAILGMTSCYVVRDAAQSARDISRKTLNADNVIYNYEHFFDLHAQVKNGITAATNAAMGFNLVKGDEAKNNKITEFNGAVKFTRTVIEQYNADSKKMNRTVFKDWRLPATLDVVVDPSTMKVILSEGF